MAGAMHALEWEADMATTRLRLPHDRRVASATAAAMVVLAATIVFLIMMLAHTMTAY
jgi:hypothetical protein